MTDTPPDPTALEQLIPDLMRLARILAPDPATAEDIAQEALLKVWTRLAEGGEIVDLRPYLMTVLRRHGTWRGPQSVPLPGELPAPAGNEGYRRATCNDVACALERLPKAQADLLREVAGGARYRDLADARGVAMGTIMSRVARARAGLRAQLGLDRAEDLTELLSDLSRG